jgi:hypothetical protein
MRQALRPGDRPHTQAHQHHLGKTRARVGPAMQTRDEPGDRDIEETGRCEREGIRKRADSPLQSEVRGDAPDDGGQPGGHVHDQGPPARHPRVNEDGKVPNPVWNLMCRDRERSHQPKRETGQKRSSDQDAIESVMHAITDNDEDPGRSGTTMVVPVMVRVSVVVTIAAMRMSLMPVAIVPVHMRTSLMPAAIFRVIVPMVRMPIPMRMPPQHQLFDDEKHPQPDEQRDADRVRAIRPNSLHGLRQQRQQRGTEQRARGIADEVRQKAPARSVRHQKKEARERRAGYAANGGKENDPDEQRQGLGASVLT